MRITGNKIGFALLGAAYLVSVFLVVRRAAEQVTSDRVTIRLSQWQLEGGVREAVDTIIRRYEELHPHVHVVQIAVPGGATYLPWIQAQMVGGVGPDLVEYSWPWPDTARNFSPISAEVMQPNPYNRGTPLEGVPWRDTFIDGMTSPDNYVQTLSQYYGVSMTTGQNRIVYNRTLLKRITGSDRPPATYREFLGICDQVRAYAKAHGLNLSPLANSRTTHFTLTNEIVANMSTQLVERLDVRHRLKVEPEDVGRAYLRGEWNYEAPELVAAFTELREVGLVSTPGFQQRERDSALTDFVSLRAVMVVAPSWEASSLKVICPFALGAFRFPFPREDDPVYGHFAKGPFGEGQVLTGMPFYLNRATPHRAEALDFLRFMSSQEGSTIFTNVSDWLPVVIGVKPSDFSARFQLQPNGYSWYGGVFGPSSHMDPQYFILNTLHHLWSTDGSVTAFIHALQDGMPAKVLDNYRHDVIEWRNNLRREDVAGAALAELAPPDRRPETIRLVSLPNEINLYQSRAVLPQMKPLRLVLAGSIFTIAAAAGQLTAGWQALANYRASQAVQIFDRAMADANPAMAREARFGRGVALLDLQPVTEGQVNEARQLFTALLNSTDDYAQGARFFLGRIAQHHLAQPDPVEAARQFRQLIAEHEDSIWAQTALSRLALLEIYELTPESPPAARLAEAEKLLPRAHTPSAQSEVHIAIADAIFFFRLPPGSALPHLLAAERLGRLDWAARTDVLVQIAELSRLAGDRQQAATYYRKFLKENPRDLRDYIVRERLAEMEKPTS